MDTDMNDLTSPSQNSPSMSGNAGQNKGSSMSENSTVVSFSLINICLHSFTSDLLIIPILYFSLQHSSSRKTYVP